MFRRYPYWGWFLLCLFLLWANFIHFNSHRQELLPGHMAYLINEDLHAKEDKCNKLLNQNDLLPRVFSDSLIESESDMLNGLPFYFFVYNGDSLVFWNTNTITGTWYDSLAGKSILLSNDKGVFVKKCTKKSYLGNNIQIVILFPIFINYPLENDYLKSHFAAADFIPVKAKVTANLMWGNLYPISLLDGTEIGYFHIAKEDIQSWTPDLLFIILLFALVLAVVFWIQLLINHYSKLKPPRIGLLLTFSVVVIFSLLNHFFGLSYNLSALPFFSPQFFSAGTYITSLSDIFINMALLVWLIAYIIRHTPYYLYFTNVKRREVRVTIAFFFASLLSLYVLLFVRIIRGLVVESNISFDVNHFYAINIYTVFGLLIVTSITGISSVVVFLFNTQLNNLLKNRLIKYAVLAVFFIAVSLFTKNLHDTLTLLTLGWFLTVTLLLDIPNLKMVSDLFEPRMIFWAILICSFCTVILQFLDQTKEKEARKTFVEQRLSPHRDTIVENSFDRITNIIRKDKSLKNFMNNPAPQTRKQINQRFETQYLTGQINQYQSKIYIFNSAKQELFNKDTLSYDYLLNEKNESANTNSAYLFYKESVLDRHFYLSHIPIYEDSSNVLLGYVIIDLDLKKRVTETVYPELLQPTVNKANLWDNEYSYAIYINSKLITQTGDYPFTITLNTDTLKLQQAVFYDFKDVAELHYKISDKRTVVVVHSHNRWIEGITLFSYIFGIQVILAVIILLYRLFQSYFSGSLITAKFLNLRRRIHFSMLSVVFVSFIIIGSVIIMFFTLEYEQLNTNKLQTALQVVKQSVQEYLGKENAFVADYMFDSVSRSKRFKYFITSLANNQKIDVNIYDNNGNLFSTSQDEIYDKGLISRLIRPEAFYRLNVSGKSLVIESEKMAGLSYLSAYQPLRDEQGVTLGYLNVPFFSSEKDLNFQISNIVVALINLYAIIFLVSSVITLFITRWITRTFNIITRQFERLNLLRNERLIWPYDDEIGTLVVEYNKMVQKVEENAALLAQSERESAWREMARQVAHEIKNPLTPMKLNIQYLQQAIKNNNPNIKQLSNRVSNSIIEQIDNLSYIASEFSDFAKMPEAKPEELDLGELLHNATELYLNASDLDVELKPNNKRIFVCSDRSQLLRVFTNLLENAKQSIPEGRKGKIFIEMIEDVSFHQPNGDSGNPTVVVSISDNGTGIDETIENKIFQPYFTTKTSGTGLGLAMTKKIIEFWKGKIWFETKINEGTTFYLRLPISRS